MSKAWPLVALGEVLRHRKEFIQIDDLAAYKRCRVQLHAQGIVLRDAVPGAEIKTKKQQVCKAGEFLVAEIDAKMGGFGIVPEGLEGAIVSSHYFLFGIDESKLNRRFLDFFIRTPAFRDQVAAKVRPTTRLFGQGMCLATKSLSPRWPNSSGLWRGLRHWRRRSRRRGGSGGRRWRRRRGWSQASM